MSGNKNNTFELKSKQIMPAQLMILRRGEIAAEWFLDEYDGIATGTVNQ